MGEGTLLLLFLGILISFFALGYHVGYALGLTSIILMLFGVGTSLNPEIIIGQMFSGIDSFTLLCIPFFLLAGRIMNESGMTSRIFNFAGQIVGDLRGGMGYVNVLASMIFAGMSGVAVADAAGLGPVEYRAMKEAGYPDGFSIGVIGSSATIGPILPPSLPIVIYAILARVSAGRMLIAGFIPGVVIGLALMVMVYFISKKNDYPRGEKRTWPRFKKAFKEGAPSLITPLILIVGILSGYFTVTEAAAVAVFYSLILGIGVYRSLNLKDLWRISKSTLVDSATITFLIAAAEAYGFLAIRSRLPIILTQRVGELTTNPMLIMFMMVGVFLIVGLFLESIAAISILVPVLMPLVNMVGLDPIHFGIIMVFTLMIGLLTPPFGAVLFVLNKSTGVDLNTAMKGVIPFYIPLFGALIVLILFPSLVMWLPGLM